MKIMIVGGSGGIGTALIKAVLNAYPGATIIATWHQHKGKLQDARVEWTKLDATSEVEVSTIAHRIDHLDILINAVGFLHSPEWMPEKTIKQFDPVLLNKNISINTLPSLLLAKYFGTGLKSDKPTFFIVVSAKVGSIEDNKIGGWLSYRTSKAALNMAVKTISIEWKQKIPNCCVLLFHPGTTDTELSRPFQKHLPTGQLHSADLTADALLQLIQQSTPEDSGRFYSFDGSEIPW